MAAETDIFRYTFTNLEGRDIPRDATHVSVHPSVTVIPAFAFNYHFNIVELICHDGVIKIEVEAFYRCPSLRRVVMLGVEDVERKAFTCCFALEHVECAKLERIGFHAFANCNNLSGINLPSAKIVDKGAFWGCPALKYAKFGQKLESISREAFYKCDSLERLTIPLKNDLITDNDALQGCVNLNQVDLIAGVLEGTIGALLFDEWKNDVYEAIGSINQILHNAYAGGEERGDTGEKAALIREYIDVVMSKIVHYEAEHLRLLNKAVSALQQDLPHDILMNNVVPFLKLPYHVSEDTDEETEGNNDSARYSVI